MVEFGAFRYDSESRLLYRGDAEVPLPPRVVAVLEALLERPGKIVSKDELLGSVWKDAFVSEDSLTQAISQLRQALGDDPSSPTYIQTIPRRGYRFIRDVVARPPASDAARGTTSRKARMLKRGLGAATAAAAILWLGVGALFDSGTDLETTRIGSIAVLPLENRTGNVDNDHVADGMTVSLITELGRFGGLRKVIAPSSVMQLKGQPRRLKQIAEELGVEAVVDASLLAAGDRVRLDVSLVHAPTETVVWSNKYERDFQDIVALYRELALDVAEGINLTLTPAEATWVSSSRRVDRDAQISYLKGRYYLNRWPSPEHGGCIQQFQAAIEKEPEWADAYAGLASCYTIMPWTLPAADVFPPAKTAAQEN